MGIYQEFRLTGVGVANVLVEFLRKNAGPALDSGHPLRVTVTSESRRRNGEQNRRLWGFVYRCVSEQVQVSGRRFSPDVWHEYFARLYGQHEDITLPDGEVIVRRKSTADMTVAEFSQYMESVCAHAATEYGVVFE